MPIECKMTFEECDRDLYHEIDHVVRGMAFDIHNEFGRFLNEELYKRELELRCAQRGISTVREVRFRLQHGDYVKEYAADMVVGGRVIYECKTKDSLVPADKAQAMNYLYLAGTQWGTLLNFGRARLQHEYVTTTLNPQERRRVFYDTSRWRTVVPACQQLRESLHALITDWGTFLEITAYRDALCHSIPNAGIENIIFYSGSVPLGPQNLHLISADVALIVTAITRDPDSIRKHYLRLLTHTRLQAIQWINFNQHAIHLETLTQPLR